MKQNSIFSYVTQSNNNNKGVDGNEQLVHLQKFFFGGGTLTFCLSFLGWIFTKRFTHLHHKENA